MTADQWKRAQEITQQLANLYEKRKSLVGVENSETEIVGFSIQCRDSGGYYAGYSIPDPTVMATQPEYARIVMKATVSILRVAYDREIKKLETEFEAL